MDFEIKYDLRNPPAWRKPWADVYAHFLDQVVWADDNGFTTVMLHEHHFSDDGYLPSPFTAAAAIAARTRRIRIRLALVLLPLKHPVQVAEDAAVLDIISGGRLEVVVGAGYVPGEFEGYGISIKQRPSRMEEAVEIIKRCWSEDEFSHTGKHWTLRNVRVMPKPLQQPMKLLMGASSPVAARRAARIADGFMAPNPLFIGPWREEMLALGKDPGPAAEPGTPSPPGNFLHVAHDPDAAWKAIGPARAARVELLRDVGRVARWRQLPGRVGSRRAARVGCLCGDDAGRGRHPRQADRRRRSARPSRVPSDDGRHAVRVGSRESRSRRTRGHARVREVATRWMIV